MDQQLVNSLQRDSCEVGDCWVAGDNKSSINNHPTKREFQYTRHLSSLERRACNNVETRNSWTTLQQHIVGVLQIVPPTTGYNFIYYSLHAEQRISQFDTP